MLDSIWGSIQDKGNAKEILDAIGKKFKEPNKTETENMMSSYMNPKYYNRGGIR